MEVIRAFRNLDRHGQQCAPEVIEEEVRQLEPHLVRFREDLVRLEVVATQTSGKTRIEVSLRLQLPSGVIAAQEEGFKIEPVLRKAFADLRQRVDRHVARLKHEPEYKRPARRRRIGAPLPSARDAAEADRRQLFFDLIEDHLDTVYDTVRRELTYLECSGSVPAGYLSVGDIVDATILNGLNRFERRPTEFSVRDWLTQLAFETVEAEAQAARRAVPEDAASIYVAPEAPAGEPTESDEEMFEFYQPDDVLLLEELVADDGGTDPETEMSRDAAPGNRRSSVGRTPRSLSAPPRRRHACGDGGPPRPFRSRGRRNRREGGRDTAQKACRSGVDQRGIGARAHRTGNCPDAAPAPASRVPAPRGCRARRRGDKRRKLS
ncbi:ribosome-associated translation inhibitor RaiA [Brevundimonas bullata]|uniref:Ribosome-associated translation inhibitor RaiA n=1 Tax=Brevundimonas bullata TaxID=13160 RepID=A0A7W7ISX9_9CAUL|nr:flagellar biosynthesis protein FliA [Brevundimonas bullata]MBB4799957.1 ribosome-associated translation inhibitor RaiA [Brevundimonas bullata]MBB6384916.1 ribosome-associated translation inhibitor RaiA [Brevundimonas bullata]